MPFLCHWILTITCQNLKIIALIKTLYIVNLDPGIRTHILFHSRIQLAFRYMRRMMRKEHYWQRLWYCVGSWVYWAAVIRNAANRNHKLFHQNYILCSLHSSLVIFSSSNFLLVLMKSICFFSQLFTSQMSKHLPHCCTCAEIKSRVFSYPSWCSLTSAHTTMATAWNSGTALM